MIKFLKTLNFAYIILLFSLFSCSSTQKTKYFQNIPDSGRLEVIAKANFTEPKIQEDDILTIIIQTIDPQASSAINSGNVSNNTNNGTSGGTMPSLSNASFGVPNLTNQSGYLVDKAGNVAVPVLGSIKVAGLTTAEARQAIQTAANSFYNNPSVIVRFANFKVNVAGEVLKPGSYVMPNEKVSILDALTMAGDLTIYGKRDNILLIRENQDGTRTPYRINLKKSDFMSSPYFYLRQNDYIYVEPGKGKAAATDVAQARNYTIAGSILSIIAIIFTRR
jgi:polysaccharide export outer membrane protein